MTDLPTKKRAPRTTISDAKLDRIKRAVYYSQSDRSAEKGNDIPVRFGYDHGNMLVEAKSGRRDLLFEHNGDILRGNACRALYELAPDITTELLRGYNIARAAGLLGDNKPPITQVWGLYDNDEVYEAIRLDLRKRGLD